MKNIFKLDCKFAISKQARRTNEPWRTPTYCTKHRGTCDAKMVNDIWTCDTK